MYVPRAAPAAIARAIVMADTTIIDPVTKSSGDVVPTKCIKPRYNIYPGTSITMAELMIDIDGDFQKRATIAAEKPIPKLAMPLAIAPPVGAIAV